MKDGLPTFYWFDTGQHLSLLIPFVFRHIKYGGLLYVLEFRNIGDHLAAFDAQDGGVMISGRDATLLSGDAHRKYMWCFEFVVMKLSSLSARTCLRYFLLFSVVQKACYILGRANICGTIAYSYRMTKVWDPGQFWTVNSYISGIIEHQTIGVDICDISSNLASLTSSADILFETFLFTPTVTCQKTVECLMIFDKIPQRCVVCWIEWFEAYERAENCDGVFSCYASPFIDLFLDSHPLCYCTPCDRQYGCMASYKVIKILFLGHPKEEVESYLAKDVAFSEHVLVGSSYSVWEIIVSYGTWFQLFGLVAARRHFKSSSGTHTTDLGRRKQQTKQLADKHCDQVVPCKTLISCMQGFDLLFRCSFEFLCTSLVCKMLPSLSISSHVPSSIHEHIRDGVYDRAVREHSHIESNVLRSHMGILQCVHPENVKIMQIASTLYEAIRANVVVVPWAFDNAVVGARLYNSNLEDKVLIGAGGIVTNGPRPVLAKQPKGILSGYV
ncbi:hypothetical protein CQW23_25119 [Capsicum baccatum]|uniref:Uncharacterized protein n=1 Tax=Capsicum baccatum TaxID=33114 RepID=A0A2G2VK32_CAPBA|nr:hypothetical protein CQW23_25119 [Capsicum baccatum]